MRHRAEQSDILQSCRHGRLMHLALMLMHADSAASTSAASVAATWWRSRFQALWMPSLRYADESMGFVQLDISLNDSV